MRNFVDDLENFRKQKMKFSCWLVVSLTRLVEEWCCRLVFSSNFGGWLVILTEIFHGVPPFLQANAAIVPHLSQDCFLPDSIQFISHPTIWHCITSVLKHHWVPTKTSSLILNDEQLSDLLSGRELKEKFCEVCRLFWTVMWFQIQQIKRFWKDVTNFCIHMQPWTEH
jgi:hypothetical protein